MININSKSGKAVNEKFSAYFLKRVSEGKTKSQAIVCIMKQLTKIIYAMMKQKSEWNVSKSKVKTKEEKNRLSEKY